MQKTIITIALASALLAPAAIAKTYAVVNGKPITDADSEFIILKQRGINFDSLTEAERRAILEDIILERLVLEDAKAQKLDTAKEYTSAIEMQKKQMLLQYWQQKQTQNVRLPSDAEVRQIYEQNKANFVDQSGKARHILVKTEAEAKAIIAELNKVKGNVEPKFIDLANQKSIEPAARQSQNGGDLGEFHRMQMVPEFSKAAFDLRPGTYTKTPVQTPFGWHIIYLNSKTEAKSVNYEQARQFIIQQAGNEQAMRAINAKVEELRKKAKVEFK